MNLDALIDALKKDEGFRGLVYDDFDGEPVTKGSTLKGYPTIGYGWNLASDPIPEPDAEARLASRALTALSDAQSLVPNWIEHDDVRQGVVANMAYNLGRAGLSKFKLFLAAFGARLYDDAADQLKASLWYKQVGVRAQRLEKEMRTGIA